MSPQVSTTSLASRSRLDWRWHERKITKSSRSNFSISRRGVRESITSLSKITHIMSCSHFADLNTMGIYHIFIVSKSGGLIFNYDHKVICSAFIKLFFFIDFFKWFLSRFRRLSTRRPTVILWTSSSSLKTRGSR